jgi:hypothetical protein
MTLHLTADGYEDPCRFTGSDLIWQGSEPLSVRDELDLSASPSTQHLEACL